MRKPGLRSIETTGLRQIFDTPAVSGRRRADVGLKAELRLARKAHRRQMLDATHVANASKLLEQLPGTEETLHCVMRGNFNAWDLIPAVVRLAKRPARALWVATLSYSRDNVGKLAAMLDAGEIKTLGAFLCSTHMRSVDVDLWADLVGMLAARGFEPLAVRNHAKVVLFDFGRWGRFAIEGSANLRSCRNVEQFTLTNSAPLFEFHRTWMAEMVAGGSEKTHTPESRTGE